MMARRRSQVVGFVVAIVAAWLTVVAVPRVASATPPTAQSITVVLDALPNDAADFGFGLETTSSFTLDDDAGAPGENADNDASRLFAGMGPGDYLLHTSGGSTSGWSLAAITCDDPDGGTITDRQMAEFEVDLDPGEQITCTFSFSRQSITVVLDALPNDAADFGFGLETTSSFTLDDDAGAPGENADNDASRLFAGMGPGDYLLHTSGGSTSGWSLAAITCDDPDGGTITDRQMAEFEVDLDPGEQITCTFSFSRQSITVVLDALPNDAADFGFGLETTSSFTLDDDAGAPGENADNDASRLFAGMGPGDYLLHTSGGSTSGWSLAAITCDDPDGGTITDRQMAEFEVDLDPGEQITCTFSFSRQSITVVLDALPNDAADFGFGLETTSSFTLDDDAGAPGENADNDASRLFAGMGPGDYLLHTSGGSTSGWSLAAITCDDPDGGTITDRQMAEFEVDLDPGEQITCTFSFSRQSITVVLDALPNDAADFGFGLETTSSFTLDDDAGAPGENADNDASRLFAGMGPGDYLLDGQPPALSSGWTLSELTCDDPDGGTLTDRLAGAATVDLDPGEQIVCTYSFSRQSLTVVLDAIPNDEADFFFNFDPLGGFTLDDDAGAPGESATWGSSRLIDVDDAGDYSVSGQAPVSGWTLAALTCDDPDGGTLIDTVAGAATVDIDPGEQIVCTYSFSRQSLTVVLDTLPNDADEFRIDFDSYGSFTLDDDAGAPGEDASYANSAVAEDLEPGDYQLSGLDLGGPGWTLAALTCDDPDGGTLTDRLDASATVDIDPGEQIVCTYSFSRQSLTVVLDTLPNDADEFLFDFDIYGSFTLDDDAGAPGEDTVYANTAVVDELDPGDYLLDGQPQTPGSGWTLVALTCVDPDGGTLTDRQDGEATVDVDPGEQITCTYTYTVGASADTDGDGVLDESDNCSDESQSHSGPGRMCGAGDLPVDHRGPRQPARQRVRRQLPRRCVRRARGRRRRARRPAQFGDLHRLLARPVRYLRGRHTGGLRADRDQLR